MRFNVWALILFKQFQNSSWLVTEYKITYSYTFLREHYSNICGNMLTFDIIKKNSLKCFLCKSRQQCHTLKTNSQNFKFTLKLENLLTLKKRDDDAFIYH